MASAVEKQDVVMSSEEKHHHLTRDLESGTPEYEGKIETFSNDEVVPSSSKTRAKELREKKGILSTLCRGEDWLDAKLGIETQGVDLIREEDKRPPSILNVFLMWWTMTCHIGAIPIGMLGPEWGLSLKQSITGCIVGTLVGSFCTGYCGTLGPKLGLRSIATSRYSFGFYGAKICSVLNIVIGGGFAVVNVVIVGQVLSAVSDYKMTIAVGCIILSLLAYIVSIFGFAVVHTWEKYAWIMSFILLCILIGQVGGKVDSSSPGKDTGLIYSGSMLNFIALCFSNASGWCSIASDYYCNYPKNTSSWKIFILTVLGLTIPTAIAEVIGCCLGNIVFGGVESNAYLTTAYEEHGLGGLLLESFHPQGFSKFCLVLLIFTVIGNNVAINYSSGLSIQLLGDYLHAIPRFIWSFLNALIIAVLAIAGREHLSLIVSNFVSLLGYWTISFTLVLLIEDKWFRRNIGYNLEIWDLPGKLPWGFAAVFALLVGYFAGGIPGMSQVWYIGPIAAKFGGFGGDVGIYFSGVLTLLVYPPARYLEIKITGK